MQVCCLPPHGSSKYPEVTAWAVPDHPLDSLTAVEVRRAAAVCKAHAASLALPELRFNTVCLKEPRKADVLAYEAGTGPKPPRIVQCVLEVPLVKGVFEADVEMHPSDAALDTMSCWVQVHGVQPMLTPDDNIEAEAIVKADRQVQELLRERYNLTDMSLVLFDCWAMAQVPNEYKSRRVMQGFLYFRNFDIDNEYAHPLDMTPIVDLDERRVVHIELYGRPTALPVGPVNYRADLFEGAFRSDVKPYNVLQPEGPSFEVEGSLVKWQKWQFRVGFDTREGLILHQIAYNDDGRLRPVLHRASVVEMVVPYGDPQYPYTRKAAFDIGEYGLGFSANSLKLGCDCLGHIKYFDGVINNSRGEPIVVKNAICMHEEDAGIAWKHVDARSGHVEVRRGRKLIVSMIATFMNYEYGFYWSLHTDGNIQMEVKLTGNLSTTLLPEGPKPSYGTLVAPGVLASNHQHFFCIRMDPAIDDPNGGRDVVISEVDVEPIPMGPENPYGNGFAAVERDLQNVHGAMRDVSYEKGRTWKMKNPNVRHPITGAPVSYKLIPAPTGPLMCQPGNAVYNRAMFARKTLFVTPHDDEQRFPSGTHIVQSERCMGLEEWTREDRPLQGADPVMWYTFGVTHCPRVEDFPVMPVEAFSFLLRPSGFFTYNPTLDLPPGPNHQSVEFRPAADAAVVTSRL